MARTRFTTTPSLLLLAGLWTATVFAAEQPKITNFHQVNDHLYRGAQPEGPAFDQLAKLGVKTIIDLREGGEHAKWEEHLVKTAGMQYVSVPMHGLEAPSQEQITKVFKVLDDSSQWPVFVHCRRGADRTGTVIACYRINHDHWQNQKALTEAKYLGMSRLEIAMRRFILGFQPAEKQPEPNLPAPLTASH